jgi:nonsense-mediated mRNA decay protein 3
MNVFKKTCYNCGKKVDKLYDNLCEECFLEKYPVIEEIKPIKIKFCNMCKKIHYKKSTIEPEEFLEKLPKLIEKNIKINNKYKLNSIKIENFEIDGIKVNFDVVFDFDLK